MKDTLKQDVKIGVCALLALVSILFTVLAFLPESGAVEVKQEFFASQALVNVGEGKYLVSAEGTLRNKTGKTVTVERLAITLSDGTVLSEEALEIPARTPVSVNLNLETGSAKTEKQLEVSSVEITVGGVPTSLRNPAVVSAFTYGLLPLILALLFSALTAHAIIVRVYIEQEKKIGRE